MFRRRMVRKPTDSDPIAASNASPPSNVLRTVTVLNAFVRLVGTAHSQPSRRKYESMMSATVAIPSITAG